MTRFDIFARGIVGLVLSIGQAAAAHAQQFVAIPELGDCRMRSENGAGVDRAREPEILPQPEGKVLRRDNSFLLDGKCVELVQSYVGASAYLTQGRLIQISSNGKVSLDRHRRDDFERDKMPGPSEAPSLNGARLAAADVVNRGAPKPDSIADYIGVWTSGRISTVASFSMQGGKPVGPTEPLLRSPDPVVSVDFFPAIDTPSGQFGLIQRLGPRRVRLINYHWDHLELTSAKLRKYPQLQNLDEVEAAKMVTIVQEYQRKLRAGELVYFELSSGAAASLSGTTIAPREAFLALDFNKARIIERRSTDRKYWTPYRLSFPSHLNKRTHWLVDLVIDGDGRLEAVRIIEKAPNT